MVVKKNVLSKREIAECAFVVSSDGHPKYRVWLRPASANGLFEGRNWMPCADYRLACAIVRAIREEIARRPDLQEEILRQRTAAALKN